MKKILSTVGILAALASVSFGAQAAGNAGNGLGKDLVVTGSVHGATEYNFRGVDFSSGDPSIGAAIMATHANGLFAGATIDTIKLAGADGAGQAHITLAGGYSYNVNPDLKLGAGLRHHQFTGDHNVGDLSFSEMFLTADYKGLYAAVASNVKGADHNIAGLNSGDVLTKVGYLHQMGAWSVGAEVGYAFYDTKAVGVKDGMTHAQLKMGYQFNNNLNVDLTYQLGGKDGAHKNNANDSAWVKVAYTF